MNAIDFIRFLDRSPSVWHAARQVSDRLAEADFIPLNERDHWSLERGAGYFVVRDDAAVCAFRIPSMSPHKATILASHLDSPCLKIKPIAEISHPHLTQFSTECYGSPILHTWFDRDVALAGRVVVRAENGEIQTHLVFLDDYPLIIPSVPDHISRYSREKGLIVDKQKELNPIVTLREKLTLESLIRKHVSFEELLAFDLFLAPLAKASFAGAEGELLTSARLDNLSSAYACLHALTMAEVAPHTLSLAVFWDHEEIGSKSHVGADSTFLNQIIERIVESLQIHREDFFRMMSRSTCLSVDLAHGFNPNYGDLYEPRNSAHLGQGVVIKFNANQRYATSASSAAPLIQLCQERSWPHQKMAFRSDIPSGATVGATMSAHLGIPCLDLGVAGWAMHSIRETIAISDQIALAELLKTVLEVDLCPSTLPL